MAIYECNACSATEVFAAFVPDCCSVCGGSLARVHGTLVDQAAIDAANYEAAETAYLQDALILRGERRRASVACLFLLLAVVVLAAMAGHSDAMGVCQQAHSFDTCFSTLNR